MKIYNTLTREKEVFKTIEKNKVKMYVCGPTVYNYIHIGNARPLVFFDTVRRYLEYKGYEVDFVMNITDIDDKIIEKAKSENVDFKMITNKYINTFLEDAKSLNVEVHKIKKPKATEYINKMIEFIGELVEKDAAYDTFDTVYFSVNKAENYGKLSKKNLEDLNHGQRIEVSEEKKNPADFALWKKQKNKNEPAWNSPWGKGRPGWHLECSAMCKSVLGETIDIHGGGEDLQFPHHENEIAQSETLNNKKLANYWMHNAMITINKDKMSKSKDNFFTLEDIKKEYDLIIVRMWLLSGHYRTQIDFSKENLDSIKNGYYRILNAYEYLTKLYEETKEYFVCSTNSVTIHKVNLWKEKFDKSMDDDFNTANALSAIFDFINNIYNEVNDMTENRVLKHIIDTFNKMLGVLGIEIKEYEIEEEIEKLINQRIEARKNKDFKKADEIRDLLRERGIELKDTANGVTWRKVD